jgi:GT2 family glycosyltransferase
MFRADEAIGSSGRDATTLTEIERTLPSPVRQLLPRRPTDPAQAHTGAVAYVEGACMLIRREAFSAVGGFDEGFFLFFEELDIAQRLRRTGWEVHLVAEASADHEVATSRASTELGGEPYFAASTYRYLAKWRGRRSAESWFTAARAIWSVKVVLGRLTRAHRTLLVKAVRAERGRWT